MGTPGSISFSLGGGGRPAARKSGSGAIGFSLGKPALTAAPISTVFGGGEASDDEEQQDQSNKRQRLESSGCLKSSDETFLIRIAAWEAFVTQRGASGQENNCYNLLGFTHALAAPLTQ